KWKQRYSGDGRVTESEICGDPLSTFRSEVRTYASTLGCTLTHSGAGTGTVRVVHECPANRVEQGRAAQKGRSELVLTASSPQAFRVEMKSDVYRSFSMEGTRIGDCP